MNIITYKALNEKALELQYKQQNTTDTEEKTKINRELMDVSINLSLYNKLFDTSVNNFITFLNTYYPVFSDDSNFDSSIKYALKIENVKVKVADFRSQFENKGEKLKTQDIFFDYALYEFKNNKELRLGKLASGNVGVLTNSENLFIKEEEIEKECLKEQTQSNTKFNLLSNDGDIAIKTIFNSKTNKTPDKLNDILWEVARMEIEQKQSKKLKKVDAKIAEMQRDKLEKGAFEAIK